MDPYYLSPKIVDYSDKRVQQIKNDAFSIYNWLDQKTRPIKGDDLLLPVFSTGGLMSAIRQTTEEIIKNLDELEQLGLFFH